jgi:DNA-binding SARP family transcriptional activator
MFARRRGQAIPAPPSSVERVERQARVIAERDALAWADLGLRYLGRVFDQELDPAGVPSVVVVRAGEHGLEIMVDPPTPAAGRFEAIDDGRVWRLDAAVDLAELEDLATERWPLLPALVNVGTSAAGSVLANLEHAGTLDVQGDPARVRGVLTQMLIELSSYPWTQETLAGLHALGETGLAATVPGVSTDADPMAAAEIMDRLADRYRRDLSGLPSAAAARAADSGWEPHVAIVLPGVAPDVLACLVEAAEPDRSGVAVVAAGPVPGGRWQLHLDAAGNATLHGRAGGEPFTLPLRVDTKPETVGMLAADLAWTDAVDTAPVVELHAEPAAPADPALGLVEVDIMGPVEINGGPGIQAVPSARRAPSLALLAYLSTHRQPVPADEIARALWPVDETKTNFGSPQKSTVNNVVSLARKMLGRDPDGEELLTYSRDGYRLSDDTSYAWTRFQALVALAANQPPAGAIVTYRRALELVRGAPLGGLADSSFFEWASSEHLDLTITMRVVDTAEALAEAALDVGDLDTARWAVDQGLAADLAREQLYQYWMHTEGRSGNPDRVGEIYRRLCDMLRKQIHVLQAPSEQSETIWRSYTAGPAVPG